MFNYAPFDGDGRKKVEPFGPLVTSQSIAMTLSQARALVDTFHASGESHHSKQAATAWAVAAYCEHQGLDYRLHWHCAEADTDEPHAVSILLGLSIRLADGCNRTE